MSTTETVCARAMTPEGRQGSCLATEVPVRDVNRNFHLAEFLTCDQHNRTIVVVYPHELEQPRSRR